MSDVGPFESQKLRQPQRTITPHSWGLRLFFGGKSALGIVHLYFSGDAS